VSSAVASITDAMSSRVRQRRAKETSSGRIGRRYDCCWTALCATLIPAAFFLGSFRDFSRTLPERVAHPRHGIRVDLDSGKHVFVPQL